MADEGFERLISTLEKNAEVNTRLATSVDGLVTEVRAQGAQMTVLSTTCAARQAEDAKDREHRTALLSVLWSVIKHPSTIILTAVALWLAAHFAVPAKVLPLPGFAGVAAGEDVEE